jgi:diguanylate cyclase (GGDEF)-like protein
MSSRSPLGPAVSRVGLLHGVRAAMAAALLVILVVADDLPAALPDVAIPLAGYLVVVTAMEVARRMGRRSGAVLARGLLVADAVFLAGLVSVAGGVAGPLGFLVAAHVVSVSLLLSHHTGLRLAVGYSLLLVGGHYLAALVPDAGLAPAEETSLAVLGFWGIALAVAIFAGLNERELLRSRSRLQSLTAMVGRLNGARQPRDVAEHLVEGLHEAFGGARCAALVLEASGACAVATSSEEEPPEGPPDAFSLREAPALLARLEAEEDALLAQALPQAVNVAVLPLRAEEDVLGLIAVECGPGTAVLGTPTLEMLEHFADQGALAARNVRLIEEVTRLAHSDPLTGLANRRAFDLVYERETARRQRTLEPLSLVLLDIDHFKQVNDEHGHDAGDEVLRHVGTRLPEAARPTDLCVRMGGEEFAVLLPGCAPIQAMQIAERLRAAIAGDAPLPITASAGVATLGVHVDAPADLLPAADEALYRAKHAGRDRVEVSERARTAGLLQVVEPLAG